MPYKEHLLKKCQERGDEWGHQVRICTEGAVSDLHATEARYHRDCMFRFFSNRSFIQNRKESLSSLSGHQSHQAYNHIFIVLKEGKAKIWNVIELGKLYDDHGGNDLSQQQLIKQLMDDFNGDLIQFSSPGYASVPAFKSQTAEKLKIIKADEDSDIDNSLKKIAKQIRQECKEICLDKSRYVLNIDVEAINDCISKTLQKLLSFFVTKS